MLLNKVTLPLLLRMPPPRDVVWPGLAPAVPSSCARPPLITTFCSVTELAVRIWNTRSPRPVASMTVAGDPPAIVFPWMVSLCLALVTSRSPVSAAFSWAPPAFGIVSL
jgi:hypothetical protein